MECIKEIQDGYEIILSKRLYEREAIISLAYKYSGRFAICWFVKHMLHRA